jgi:hypothetical protein
VQANCEIACPGYKRWVLGYYDVDKKGAYKVGPNGLPLIERTFCFNERNTCSFDTCLLHRAGKGAMAPKAVRLFPNTFEKVDVKRKR